MRDPLCAQHNFIAWIMSHFYKFLFDNRKEFEGWDNTFIIFIPSELRIILTDEVKIDKKCWLFSHIHWWSLWTVHLLNFKYLQKPVQRGSVQVLGKEMVKSFFWFISNPAIWSDWKFRPANVFCKTEKSSFGFWTLNTHGSKGNFQKLLTCVNHVYFKHRTVVFRSKKNFNFPFQKNWISFFPHAEFILFSFQKSSIMEERSTKKQILLKQKRNCSKL